MKKYSNSVVYLTKSEVSAVRVEGVLSGYVWHQVFGEDVFLKVGECKNTLPLADENGKVNMMERIFIIDLKTIESLVASKAVVLDVVSNQLFEEMVAELSSIEAEAAIAKELANSEAKASRAVFIEMVEEAKRKKAAEDEAIAAYILTPHYLRKKEIDDLKLKVSRLYYKLPKIDKNRMKDGMLALEGITEEMLISAKIKFKVKEVLEYEEVYTIDGNGETVVDWKDIELKLLFITYKDCLLFSEYFTELDKQIIEIKEANQSIYRLSEAYKVDFPLPTTTVPVESQSIIEIEAGAVQYLSEINDERFKDGLPYGIVNKKKTDAGGTFFTMACGVNYIVVCPRKELVNSICKDKNLDEYGIEVQGLHSSIDICEIAEYIARNEGKVLKFAVTWDSFDRLCNEIETMNIMFDFGGLSSFKVMVDEYQMLLDEVGYREAAVFSLFKRLNKSFAGRYTFLSATPTPEKYMYDELKKLPFYQINWANEARIRPILKETRNLTAELDKMIRLFNSGGLTEIPAKGYLPGASEVDKIPVRVEELYIYLNSVKAIVGAIESMDNNIRTSKVRVICGDKEANIDMLEEIGVKRSNSTDLKPKEVNITFLTSTGFQGCNFFSNNALSIVVSKANNEATFLSIDTTIPQIMGRLRFNDKFQNVFHNVVIHLCNVKNTDFMREAFIKNITEAECEANNYVSKWSTVYNDIDKKAILPRALSTFCTHDKDTDTLLFSNMKKMARIQQYETAFEVYKNGATVADNYRKKGYDVVVVNGESNDKGGKKINLSKYSFKARIEDYFKVMDSIKAYEESVATDTPFGEADVDKTAAELYESNKAYAKSLEKAEGMYQHRNTLEFIYKSGITKHVIKNEFNYKRDEIVARIIRDTPETKSIIFKEIFEAYTAQKDKNGFISNKDLKVIINSRFKLHGFNGNYTASELDECKWIEVSRTRKSINGKQVEGVSIKVVK